ncbi:TetR/AcrR family transcriptional regulator [Leucobacter sp. W1038]|uniref:TetR/AcrR family transcriptional regulator n=1 Tax=Leucobacter sp. W1038 TaxID=3438281 RepID=UPI003D99D13E
MKQEFASIPEPPKVGVRQASKLRQRNRIEEEAGKLLLTKTFDEITTKEVAAAAGVGESTLFRYIQSKQTLLTMVYGDRLDEILTRAEENDAEARFNAGNNVTGKHFTERALAAYRLRCDFYLQNPVNAALYLREGFSPDAPDVARHIAQGDRSIRLLTSIIREGQENRSLREDIEAAIVAQNCHGAFIHEIDRTPVRHFDPQTIWERLERRLVAQLRPLEIT